MPSNDRRRVALRLESKTHERVLYWADQQGVSVNEYITAAVEAAIARENGDYDLPTLEIARLNQLVDETKALSTNVGSLEQVVTTMASSIIGLAKGDNYLFDDAEDGELPVG